MIVKKNRASYIKKFLKLNNELHTGFDKKLCGTFADDYLRDDGVFVIRTVAKNSTDLVATDLIGVLWKLYRGKRIKKHDDDTPIVEPTTSGIDKEKELLNP